MLNYSVFFLQILLNFKQLGICLFKDVAELGGELVVVELLLLIIKRIWLQNVNFVPWRYKARHSFDIESIFYPTTSMQQNANDLFPYRSQESSDLVGNGFTLLTVNHIS